MTLNSDMQFYDDHDSFELSSSARRSTSAGFGTGLGLLSSFLCRLLVFLEGLAVHLVPVGSALLVRSGRIRFILVFILIVRVVRFAVVIAGILIVLLGGEFGIVF